MTPFLTYPIVPTIGINPNSYLYFNLLLSFTTLLVVTLRF